MRSTQSLWALPLLAVLAAPVAARPYESDRRYESDRVEDAREVAREIERSPAVGSLPGVLGALTDALLDLPVGRIMAAARGDTNPDPDDAERTIADIGEERDPYFRERTRDEVRAAGAAAAGTTRAVARTLPEIARSADVLERELERVARSLPLPRD